MLAFGFFVLVVVAVAVVVAAAAGTAAAATAVVCVVLVVSAFVAGNTLCCFSAVEATAAVDGGIVDIATQWHSPVGLLAALWVFHWGKTMSLILCFNNYWNDRCQHKR